PPARHGIFRPKRSTAHRQLSYRSIAALARVPVPASRRAEGSCSEPARAGRTGRPGRVGEELRRLPVADERCPAPGRGGSSGSSARGNSKWLCGGFDCRRARDPRHSACPGEGQDTYGVGPGTRATDTQTLERPILPALRRTSLTPPALLSTPLPVVASQPSAD